jgi:hypothetical protein
MPTRHSPTRQSLLQCRVDPSTAARVRFQADRAGQTISEWIGHVLRREVQRAGAADALAAHTFEAALTIGYMLRTLMIDTLGANATDRAVEQASDAAAQDSAAELARAEELAP